MARYRLVDFDSLIADMEKAPARRTKRDARQAGEYHEASFARGYQKAGRDFAKRLRELLSTPIPYDAEPVE